LIWNFSVEENSLLLAQSSAGAVIKVKLKEWLNLKLVRNCLQITNADCCVQSPMPICTRVFVLTKIFIIMN
jgi:hypothetical protein